MPAPWVAPESANPVREKVDPDRPRSESSVGFITIEATLVGKLRLKPIPVALAVNPAEEKVIVASVEFAESPASEGIAPNIVRVSVGFVHVEEFGAQNVKGKKRVLIVHYPQPRH